MYTMSRNLLIIWSRAVTHDQIIIFIGMGAIATKHIMATRASGPTRMSLRPFRAKDYKRIFAGNDVISGRDYLREDALEDGAISEENNECR